jgi:hypothetical protein
MWGAVSDLHQKLVPHVMLEFSHFLFLNSGVPLVLEDGNSKKCETCLSGSLLSFNQ